MPTIRKAFSPDLAFIQIAGLTNDEVTRKGLLVEEAAMRAWCRNLNYAPESLTIAIVPDHLQARPIPQRITILIWTTVAASGATLDKAIEEIVNDVKDQIGHDREVICSFCQNDVRSTRLGRLDTTMADLAA